MTLHLSVPVGPLNYMGNNHTSAMEQPTKRAREAESISRQQKHLVSLNNNYSQDKAGQSGSILNPNPVSTGLKLAYEEDEHNSSVTSASESMTAALPAILSLSDNLKLEMDRQNEEFDCYIRLQVIILIQISAYGAVNTITLTTPASSFFQGERVRSNTSILSYHCCHHLGGN